MKDDPALQAAIAVMWIMAALVLFMFAAILVVPLAFAYGGYQLYRWHNPPTIETYVPDESVDENINITHNELRQHGAIFGRSGQGKTQILYGLITREIYQNTPMIILDSTGAIMQKLEQLEYFAQNDRLIVLDPTDKLPPALNFFRLPDGISDARKNELFQYIFKAIDRELTPKMQGSIPYLMRLMDVISDATLLTLVDVLTEHVPKNAESRYQRHIDTLDPLTQTYFNSMFVDRQEMGQTRSQIANRIMEVLGDDNFRKMFTAAENRFDITRAIAERKVVVVNTSQDALGDKGSSVFGRYIIAQCRAAAFARASISEHDRHLALLIVDEASEYLDDTTERILSQTRQFGLGMVIATQYLDKIPDKVRAAIYGNTAILMAGGLGHSDASALGKEMQVPAEVIMNMPPMNWVTLVKGRKPRHMIQQYGVIDEEMVSDDYDRLRLRQMNRIRYGIPESLPTREAPPRSIPATTDRTANTAAPRKTPPPLPEQPGTSPSPDKDDKDRWS